MWPRSDRTRYALPVPLFEIKGKTDLVPFSKLHGGPQLYESEIEDLLWDNPDELTGQSLFPVARQPSLVDGGIPDIVALDRDARVVVIEVKRDIDRSQLAQCLEYAGWARTTNLDELAGMYYRGAYEFFADWQEFTESASPTPIRRAPQLVLVARDFHGRTGSALEFLVENKVPISLIRISLYEDADGRRFVDVEGEHEADLAVPAQDETGSDFTKIDGKPITTSDLMDWELLDPGQPLVWTRPKLGQEYHATVGEAGMIVLSDGRAFASPSRAAKEAAGIAAYDGWYAWRVPTGETLHALRKKLVEKAKSAAASNT